MEMYGCRDKCDLPRKILAAVMILRPVVIQRLYAYHGYAIARAQERLSEKR